MKFFTILNILFFTFCHQAFIIEGLNLKLELVQVIFRHGDRIPDLSEIYPTDPYDSLYYKPQGYGRLTKVGMNRAYDFGKMLRERYDDFLGDYIIEQVHAESSDFTRTKMSLLLVLAGLYPPSNATTWNENLLWLPIPTRYQPNKSSFLRPIKHSCARYNQLRKMARNSIKVKNLLRNYDDFFADIAKTTNISITDPLKAATHLIANIQSVQSMGLPMPKWCSANCYKTLEEVADINYNLYTNNIEMSKYVVGPTMRRILKNIQENEEEKNYDDNNITKIYLYGAHDVNIATITRGLGIKNVPKIPRYSSALIFEKLSDENNKTYVKMYYWTGVTKKLILLQLNQCNSLCPLTNYKHIMKPILPTPEDEECLGIHRCA